MLNPTVTNITLNGSGGNMTAILLQRPGATSRWAVMEDPANAGFGQGLIGYYIDPLIATLANMALIAGLQWNNNQTNNPTQAQVQTALNALTTAQLKTGLLALKDSAGFPGLQPNVQQKWLSSATAVGQGYQPIQGGDWLRVHAGYGPPWQGAPGSGILLLQSATVTATGIILTEWG